ncbi:Obg-like ATPase [Acrasis kona]
MTPHPDAKFPGLKDGDKWCLCVSRWIEAKDAGLAPPVFLESSHENVLDSISLEEFRKYSGGSKAESSDEL